MAITDFITDLADVLVFILSGFLAINIALHLSQRQVRDSNAFDITLWSLAGSILIYGAILALDILLARVGLVAQGQLFPFFPIIALVLAPLFGILYAYILLTDIGGSIRQRLQTRAGARGRIGPISSVWHETFLPKGRAWLLVYTTDGKEYKGWYSRVSLEGEPRELVISDPRLIIRKDGLFDSEVLLGKEMLFLEKDIRRLAFLQ